MSRRARSEPYAEGQGLPVRPGEVVVVRDEGMPIYDSARIKRRNAKGKDGNDDDIEKGDLYISFEIEMPSQEWLFNINSKVRFWSNSIPVICSAHFSIFGLYYRVFCGSFRIRAFGLAFRALLFGSQCFPACGWVQGFSLLKLWAVPSRQERAKYPSTALLAPM